MFASHQPWGSTGLSIQQPEMTWNGKSWSPSGTMGATTTSSYESTWQESQQYSSPTIITNNVPQAQAAPTKSLVTMYTEYYHGYIEQAKAWEPHLRSANESTRKSAEEQYNWAKFQADESSRAAHYFHQNPGATEAPFTLPPPPFKIQQEQASNSSSSSANQSFSSSPQQHESKQGNGSTQSQQASTKHLQSTVCKQSEDESPNSLQDFIHRALSPYVDQYERNLVMEQVQKLIQQAITDGSFHMKDWSQVPLPFLSQPKSVSQQFDNNSYCSVSNQSSKFSSFSIARNSGSRIKSNLNVVTDKDNYQQQQSKQGNGSTQLQQATTKHLQQESTNQHQNEDESPEGLKDFVHRALLQCVDQQEKDLVKEHVEKLIQQAIMDGSFHMKDWSQVPLPVVSQPKFIDSYRPVSNQSNKFPSFSATRNSKSRVKSASKVASDKVNYYGPVKSSSHQSSPNQQQKPQLSSKFQCDYYGPSSSQDSSTSSEEFIALPQKKRKIEHQTAGFDQTLDALDNRAKRFAGRGGISDASSSLNSVLLTKGFDRYMGKETIGGKAEQLDYEQMTVKGTCQTLEKDYLRLTAPPRPELVRPQVVLEQHVKNLKAERSRPKIERRDYAWFCSQFKAVRQDCTVQRIQNAFAVDVYETHARIALEDGDLNEYNQCQTQLKELYDLVSLKSDSDATKNRTEFLAYRLIYYVFLTENRKYTGGSSDLFHLMLSLTSTEREDPSIRHALKVREAVADADYHAFFRLRETCPNLGVHLMDYIVPTIRHKGLLRISKAYRPSVDVPFVARELGFLSGGDEAAETEYCRKWLESCACVIEGMEFITKDSVVRESDMEVKTSLI